MQQVNKKTLQFWNAVGDVIRQLREENTQSSISKLAREYDMDRGNLSKLERGLIGCYLLTAWKISEACGIKFSEFAKRLEEKLGDDFILMDE